MSTPDLVVGKRLYIKKGLIPDKAIKQRYKIELFDEKMCSSCDNLPNRPNDLCSECPGFLAAYKLFKEHDEQYWSVPQGDYLAITKLLQRKNINFTSYDKRKPVKFQTPIKFTGKLFGANHYDENGIKRINQVEVIKQWWKYKQGILKAKPRAGKTVLSAFAICRLKQRTIIMTDRKELINQFKWVFLGKPATGGNQARPAMSNIPQLREKTGKEIVRLVESQKDLQNLDDVDILLVNYQKFVRKPERIVELIEGKFSFLVVDEVHGSGAEGYLRVVSKASFCHRMGLTATERRKDNRHKLIHRIMGPVTAASESASLIPRIEFYQSKVEPPRAYKVWHHAMNWLSSNTDLKKELLKQLFKDLRSGHKVVIVPLDRKNQIDQLVKMVNHQAKVNNQKRGENWPEDLALKFYNGVNRQEVLDKVDDGNPRILFAIRSMVKQGIDFTLPSKIHIFVPMSASTDSKTGAPMFEQLSNRVCTPADKPDPVVMIWVHNVNMFRTTVIGLFWNEIAKNKWNGKTGKYRVDQHLFNLVKGFHKKKASAQNNSFDWV